MPTAKDYREHAAELKKLAKAAKNREEGACLEALANEWLRIAGNLEHDELRRIDEGERRRSGRG